MSIKAKQPLSFAEMILEDVEELTPHSVIHDFPQRTSTPTSAADSGRDSIPRGGGHGLSDLELFRIQRAAKVSMELDAKTDEEISDLLLKHIWAKLTTGTLEAELIDQAISRLRGEQW